MDSDYKQVRYVKLNRNLNVRLPDEMHERLHRAAEKTGIRTADLVRDALEAYLPIVESAPVVKG